MTHKKSEALFAQGQEVLVGGVNSPVRAFGAVGMSPLFIQEAQGAYLTDVDGNTYLDFVGSWGPMITGHNRPHIKDAITKAMAQGLSFGAATEMEITVAELICKHIPSVEKIRMVSSGTEAVMSALRVARGFTGRDKIIKFAGCYHGHCDSMLVKAGSGALTGGHPDSAGVPTSVAQDTLLADYNDLDSVLSLFAAHKGEIAAVILEPVAANMGVVPPEKDFLPQLRTLCTQEQTLLIFDEVITGFRLAFGGAQSFYGVTADLVTYGKIIGGGLPVGAYGGRAEIMNRVAPLGDVYQAGTLSGNPLAMAAGYACLTDLLEHPSYYEDLNHLGTWFAQELQAVGKGQITVNQVGSLVCPFFTQENVTHYQSAKTSHTQRYAQYFRHMLEGGVYLAPSQFEAMFLSTAHRKEELEKVLEWGKPFFQGEQ